jgi:hypothetical protein
MANRWPHRIAGFVCYLIFFVVCIIFIIQHTILGVSGIFIHLGLTDIPWITVGLAMSVFGAELPDYDKYHEEKTAGKKRGKGDDQKKSKTSSSGKTLRSLTRHRSGLTHSPLIPFCVLFSALALMPTQGAVVATILLVFFLFGHASHLALDIHESKDAKKGEKKDNSTKKPSKGKPPKNKYCLHFGIATASEQATKRLLIIFGGLEILIGALVLVVVH